MKQEWISYLQEISVPDRYVSNVEKKINEVSSIFNTEIKRIFVCNRQSEQKIEYSSLWLFSEDRVYECKNFISKEDYDVLIFRNKIAYVNIQKSDFDNIENPSTTSSLNAVCLLKDINMSCSLSSVGVNTKYLLELLKEIYLKNLI